MADRIRKCCIALLVLFAAGCNPLDEFEAGPLGAVEISEDEPVRIRSLFPITGPASSHGASLGQAIELAVRDFGSMHGRTGDPYTTALVSAFGSAFRTLGGEVTTAGIAKGDTDMTAVLAEFAAAGAEGLFVPLFLAEGSLFIEQTREFDGLEDAALITGSAMLVPEFLASPQSEGMYFAGPVLEHGPEANGVTGKNADAVLAAFENTYGGAPASPYWAHAYDAATLLLAAIESVAVEKGETLYVDRLALRQEIAATTGFQAIIGVLSCDDFGDCGTGRINIYRHLDTSVTDAAQLPVVYRFEP